MKKYETVVVFDGSLPEETIAKEQQKVEEFLKEKGSLEKIDVWGKKDLAYEIGKSKTGFYSLFTFELDGNATELIDNLFRFNDNVIRHITVLFEDSAIVKKVAEVKTPAEGDE